jgi:hypothetical protein
MSLMRRVPILGSAVFLAVFSAGAQTPLSPNESSSNSFQLASLDSSIGAPPLSLFPAPAAAGAGAGQGGRATRRIFSMSNIAAEAGAGFNAPIGNDGPYLTFGGNFTGGGGLHLSRRVSLLAEYQFMDNKLPGSLIAEVGTQGGNAHIWSLTLDPVIDLFPKWKNSVYVTGGGGFYRKLTSFTDPQEEEVCTFYCGIVVQNATVYHFSSNQGGANLGFGITHRLGGTYGDGSMKLFAEARYTFLNTPSITQNNGLGSTETIPVNLGLRW